eukprot:2397943-Rhodomonas_salina.1
MATMEEAFLAILTAQKQKAEQVVKEYAIAAAQDQAKIKHMQQTINREILRTASVLSDIQHTWQTVDNMHTESPTPKTGRPSAEDLQDWARALEVAGEQSRKEKGEAQKREQGEEEERSGEADTDSRSELSFHTASDRSQSGWQEEDTE